MVANVNKSKISKQSAGSRRTPKPILAKRASSEKVKKQGRTKKAKTGEQLAFAQRCQEIAQEVREEQAESRSSGSQCDEDCTEFVENNQNIRMAVDQDDSFYEKEMASEEESEISMDEQMASGCLAMDQGHSPHAADETTTNQGGLN